MLTILKTGRSAHKVPPEKSGYVWSISYTGIVKRISGISRLLYSQKQLHIIDALFKRAIDLSATQIGLLSSCMLIAYGISKGVMSSLADKASPKVFMACGLVLCVIVNVGLGFSSAFWIFAALVVFNGLFQGMGVGPSFITIANWFPRRERGRVGAFWNISHNVGGGIVAPIVGAAFAILGSEHWQSASYIVPACVAVILP